MPLSPAAAIEALYAQRSDDNKFPAAVTELFRQQYGSEDAFNQIPALDLQHPPESFVNGSLVSFNAMVQDTSISPELYLGRKANGECGGWGMNDSQADQVDYADLKECSVFWVVSIPGLSPWCGSRISDVAPSHRGVHSHKNPVPEAPFIGLQLKVYDEALAQPLRTTDLISLVGILTSEPLHASIDLPEPERVPTLHLLFSRPLATTILHRLYPEPSLLPTVNTIRNELIQWIANEALAGDLIAAEWIFLSLISRVRSRNPPILPLSLTISSFPSPSGDQSATPTVHHVLSLIFPIVNTLPLSLNTLNNTSACPESKEEDLHSGWLQHPKGSILVLTEGAVTEGGIFNKGVMNIRSVQEMMKSQVLDYIFPFSGFQFETDVNFLVLSEGKQSTFFKTDVNISLCPRGFADDARAGLYKSASEITFPPETMLAQFRQLVGGAKVGTVVISEETGKHIEEEFVKERSANAAKEPGFTPDDLIQRMLIARLTALSWHKDEVTIDSWNYAKELERSRRK